MPNKSVAITRRTAVESENEANRPTQGCVPPRMGKGREVGQGRRSLGPTYKCKTLNNFIFFQRNAAPAQSES